jgi:integrase
MTTTLPYFVKPFTNGSGTTSFQVSGSQQGERVRKNFSDRGLAEAFCNKKNAEALQIVSSINWQVVQTRATEKDVRQLETALDRVSQRWSVAEVMAAGLEALEARVPAKPVSALIEEWLLLVQHEVSARWYNDLKWRLNAFAGDHPDLTTDRFNRSVVRGWLDRLPYAQQSKSNMRSAVHRFGRWLVERGFVRENPASEIRISRRKTGAQQGDQTAPTVFSPLQCEALLRACEMGACRRLLGWMAACLFTGMRPESEAPRATWSEVNFATSEWSVMGRKRGAKPRIIKLTPTALHWMKIVEADKLEKPALYSRRAKAKAIELANAWLKEKHPTEKPIVWDEDITRHTFASHRAPQVPVHELAGEMGNSPGTIYAHYRHPRNAADVAAFWAIRSKPVGAE